MTSLYYHIQNEAQASALLKGQAQSSDVQGNEMDLKRKKNKITDNQLRSLLIAHGVRSNPNTISHAI